jgi:hypothetical protein
MSDNINIQSPDRVETIVIKTIEESRVIIREAAAPGTPGPQGNIGPQGIPGQSALNIDGGNASSNYGSVPPIDGGNP